jgi:3',5'-cyclic AMP phosphodiesterase CpdA
VRIVAHISDLHFGRENPRVVEGLAADLSAQRPSLVAVSGDLTQRARPGQFAAARSFLDRLPFPFLAVPGNHDIPLLNPMARFLWPLDRYRRFLGRDPNPGFGDEEILVLGVNTARSNTRKEGRISWGQIAFLKAAFATPGDRRFKMLVVHHPFVAPEDWHALRVIGRNAFGLAALEEGEADMILSGHHHRRYAGEAPSVHLARRGTILVSYAGSAVSDRLRGEPNSFNLISIDGRRVRVQTRSWNGERFVGGTAACFTRSEKAWIGTRLPDGGPAPAQPRESGS